MVALVAIGLIVWLIYMIAKRRQPLPGSQDTGMIGSRWYEYLLATILLIALVGLAIWLLVWGVSQVPPEGGEANWRADPKATVLIVILGVGVGIALLAFLIALLTRSTRQDGDGGETRAESVVTATTTTQNIPTPAATRLLGLLFLALAILLLGWLYLTPAQQYTVLLQLLYPASLGVALVLLFDKASRAWSPGTAWANFREWLYCDGIVVLFLLGFINLLNAASSETYHGFFWDVLHIVLFFFVFWLLDRKFTRYRFLVAQIYLLLLPLLLLIWRSAHAIAPVEGVEILEVSFWQTVWPFFFLALIAFVLEIIGLIATRHSDSQAVPAIKDILFIGAYAILLIIAIPEAVA